MKTIPYVLIGCCAFIIILVTSLILINNRTEVNRELKSTVAKAPVIQAQKFRFGEQCPDGLRVEYISTIRLPKAIVCQKAVGE